jgi:hypothetical protein
MIFELLLADLDRISLIILSLTCKKFKGIFDSFGEDKILRQDKIGLNPNYYTGSQRLSDLLVKWLGPHYRLVRNSILRPAPTIFINMNVYGNSWGGQAETEWERRWDDYYEMVGVHQPS